MNEFNHFLFMFQPKQTQAILLFLSVFIQNNNKNMMFKKKLSVHKDKVKEEKPCPLDFLFSYLRIKYY